MRGREDCGLRGFALLHLRCLSYGPFGIIGAVIASTTYVNSGLFTYTSVFIKGLFKQLHPTPISFVPSVSLETSVPKMEKFSTDL